jgi:hypothetical protein
VPEALELADERDEEGAEVGLALARPHLGDEQDPHGQPRSHVNRPTSGSGPEEREQAGSV